MKRLDSPPSIDELFAAETLLCPQVAHAPRGELRALLAAAAPYAVGMGGLNLQAVWESLRDTGVFACDRAFSDFPDGAPLLPPRDLPSYDVVGFSLPYELDWLRLPVMLKAGGVPIWSEQRGDDLPIIIAGGASMTMNPEPLAEIIDAFVIGEAEPLIPGLARVFSEAETRGDRLAALADLPGVYVPSRPLAEPVQRLVWEGIVDHPRTSLVLSPHTAFPDRYLIETGRGCPMGCRFCLAGSIYRPVRYATRGSILDAAREGLRAGERIGLIGASLSGYPDLSGLVGELVALGADVSLSSLRADRVTPELVRALVVGGQHTITIAPETASDPLRKAIGKDITLDELLSAIAAAAAEGIREVKLYFMTDLPGEREDDRRAIALLVESYVSQFPGLRFAVTLSPFVPKLWTSFEDQAFPSVPEARSHLESAAAELRRRTNVDVRPGSARWSGVQAALARGDRSIGRALAEAAEKGGGYSALKTALKSHGINLDEPLLPPADPPWRRALGVAEVCGSAGNGESGDRA